MSEAPILEKDLNLETIESEDKLSELIQFAREICLQASCRVTSSEPQNPQKLPPKNTYFRRWEDSKRYKNIDMPPPELLTLYPNTNLMQEIEQFGGDLLDESFLCLGNEGENLLKQFIDSEDIKTRLSVCQSLHNLIADIDKKAKLEFDEYDYNPIRLSPKLIGIYPDINFSPTCLGIATLATSFFHKAGVPVLHGGVFVPNSDNGLLSEHFSMDSALKVMPKDPLVEREDIFNKLIQNMHNTLASVLNHRGFHAATYARLNNETWVQIDVNYDAFSILVGDDTQKLNETYNQLQEHKKDGYINSEIDVELSLPDDYFFCTAVEDYEQFVPKADEIEKILKENDVYALYEILIHRIFAILLPSETLPQDMQEVKELKNLRKDIAIIFDLLRLSDDNIMDLLHETFEEYVFPDHENGNFSTCFHRCQKDSAYLQRRVADLQLAPVMFILKLQSWWYEIRDLYLKQTNRGHHPYIEVGLPEYRSGITVLSDIASHYEDPLPLSTWLTYWSSDISLIEHHEQSVDSETQQSLARTAVGFTLKKPKGILTYLTTGIILSKADHPTEEDQDDGQGGSERAEQAPR